MSNTIRGGRSVSINVQTGETLVLDTITGTFTASITAGVGTGTVLATDSSGGGSYGPYSSAVVILVKCSADGLTDYEVGTAPDLDYAIPVTARNNPLTGVSGFFGPGGEQVPTSFRRSPMITVACGNSIAAANKFGGALCSGDIHTANLFNGSVMRFVRMVATTRADLYGVYGYSGATLDTINGDIEAQWFAPMHTAGVIPDLVIGHSLLENDIIQNATYEQIVGRLQRWIANVRRFPGVMIQLLTPRPSTSYNTASMVAVFEAVTAYMLTLDDGWSIYVTKLNGYANPLAASQPLGGYTNDGLHPNTKGGMANGRSIAATQRRIAQSVAQPFRAQSSNFGFIGTSAATGTNVSGTVPTGASFSGTSLQTYLSSALNPGWTIQSSQVAGVVNDNMLVGVGSVAVAGGANTQVSAYATIEIVSGAEFLAWAGISPRINDGGGNNFQNFISKNSGDADGDFVNGDILTYRVPPQIASSGSITAVQPYFLFWFKTGGSGSLSAVTGTVVFRVIDAGVCVTVA